MHRNPELEIKLTKDRSRQEKLVDEINADIVAFATGYNSIIFLVYDLGTIRNEIEFKQDLELSAMSAFCLSNTRTEFKLDISETSEWIPATCFVEFNFRGPCVSSLASLNSFYGCYTNKIQDLRSHQLIFVYLVVFLL